MREFYTRTFTEVRAFFLIEKYSIIVNLSSSLPYFSQSILFAVCLFMTHLAHFLLLFSLLAWIFPFFVYTSLVLFLITPHLPVPVVSLARWHHVWMLHFPPPCCSVLLSDLLVSDSAISRCSVLLLVCCSSYSSMVCVNENVTPHIPLPLVIYSIT